MAGENIGKFAELMANRQSFLPQFYRGFNLRIYLEKAIRQVFSPK